MGKDDKGIVVNPISVTDISYTQTKELENTKPFSNETDLVTLVKRCLQVNSAERPTAKEALTVFKHVASRAS